MVPPNLRIGPYHVFGFSPCSLSSPRDFRLGRFHSQDLGYPHRCPPCNTLRSHWDCQRSRGRPRSVINGCRASGHRASSCQCWRRGCKLGLAGHSCIICDECQTVSIHRFRPLFMISLHCRNSSSLERDAGMDPFLLSPRPDVIGAQPHPRRPRVSRDGNLTFGGCSSVVRIRIVIGKGGYDMSSIWGTRQLRQQFETQHTRRTISFLPKRPKPRRQSSLPAGRPLANCTPTRPSSLRPGGRTVTSFSSSTGRDEYARLREVSERERKEGRRRRKACGEE